MHEVAIPVYFAVETPELTEIHNKMAISAANEWSSSVASSERERERERERKGFMMSVYSTVLLSAVLGERYQMMADASEPKVLENH